MPPELRSEEDDDIFLVGDSRELTTMNDNIKTIIQWTLPKLSAYTNLLGEHSIVSVLEMSQQVVSGTIYEFELKVEAGESNQAVCKVAVYDQTWTGIREFHKLPRCRAVVKRLQ
jgi:hypothetical protein